MTEGLDIYVCRECWEEYEDERRPCVLLVESAGILPHVCPFNSVEPPKWKPVTLDIAIRRYLHEV